MKLLLLCHAFNGLTQRLHGALREAGHEVTVELDIADAVTEEAVALAEPDLVIAPFLKRRIPESVWSVRPCLVVHPGPAGAPRPAARARGGRRGGTEGGGPGRPAPRGFPAGPGGTSAWIGHACRPAEPARAAGRGGRLAGAGACRSAPNRLDRG